MAGISSDEESHLLCGLMILTLIARVDPQVRISITVPSLTPSPSTDLLHCCFISFTSYLPLSTAFSTSENSSSDSESENSSLSGEYYQ